MGVPQLQYIILMSSKWLPAASSARPFWALTRAATASTCPPGPSCLRSDGYPCQHFPCRSWLDAFKSASSKSTQGKEALCLPWCSLLMRPPVLFTKSNSHHPAHYTGEQQRQDPNPMKEGRSRSWTRCSLNPSLGKERSKSPYSLSKTEYVVNISKCKWATMEGLSSYAFNEKLTHRRTIPPLH